MRTVGEVLKEGRLKKNFSLEKVAELTKIQVKFLKALEENDFAKIPQGVTTKGFIRNYAQISGLNPDNVLAVFRRDFLENEKGQIIPRGMVTPLNKITFAWNPKLTLVAGVFFLLLILFVFFGRQYLNLVSAPKLSVIYPPDNQISKQKEIEFIGKTDKDASLYINGEIVNLGQNGEFDKKISLVNGENEVIFEAISREGKKTRLVRKVKAEVAN